MTKGWAIALLLIVGATLLLVGLNLRLWRRYRTAVQARVDYTAADFDRDCVARGADPGVPPVLRAVLADWYSPDLVPQPADDFARYLQADGDDVARIADAARRALGLPAGAGGEELIDINELALRLSQELRRGAGRPSDALGGRHSATPTFDV